MNIDATITEALALLQADEGERIDFRIGQFQKVLNDHQRTGGCIHGEQCRTYCEARRILAEAVTVR